MKRVLIGILQLITYCIVYEVIIWIVYFVGSLLYSIIAALPVLKIFFTNSVMEGVIYSLCPIISGIAIVYIMGLLFRKTLLFLAPTIIMIAILFFTNISTIVSSAYTYGIISWGFANAAWSSIILSIIVAFGLFSLTGYRIRRNDADTDNEADY